MTNPTPDAALLPCPFCGGAAKDDYHEAYSIDSSYSYIGCGGDYRCGARIPYDSDGWGRADNRDAAITVWNRRAGQSHADAGLLAALEAVWRQIAQQRGGALYPNDADGFEMALDDIDEAVRAAIAAAKGAGK